MINKLYLIRFIFPFIVISCFNNSPNKITSDNLGSEIPDVLNSNLTTKTSLKFKNQTFDFGNVKNDTIINARYYFINTGEEPLIIEILSPDCSCTNSKVSSKITLPNEKGYIELILDTSEKSGSQLIGAIVKFNTEQEFYKLSLEGNVESL